jgi:hypothetical protein
MARQALIITDKFARLANFYKNGGTFFFAI